jgi:hypothetical protein
VTASELGALDELCRLALAARRSGCRIHLDGADGELRALRDLAGLAEVLPDCPNTVARRRDRLDVGAVPPVGEQS